MFQTASSERWITVNCFWCVEHWNRLLKRKLNPTDPWGRVLLYSPPFGLQGYAFSLVLLVAPNADSESSDDWGSCGPSLALILVHRSKEEHQSMCFWKLSIPYFYSILIFEGLTVECKWKAHLGGSQSGYGEEDDGQNVMRLPTQEIHARLLQSNAREMHFSPDTSAKLLRYKNVFVETSVSFCATESFT